MGADRLDNDFKLKVELRTDRGSTGARRLRKTGNIPVNIYGGEAESSICAYVAERDFLHAASKALPSQVFTIESSDSFLNGKQVIVKEIQNDYIHSKILHIDMVLLQEGREVVIKVPLKIVGDAYGVKNQGGVLTVILREVDLICLPESIPTILEVNVSDLKLGQRVTTGDLNLPQGARLKGKGTEVIASIIAGRAAKTARAQEGGESEEGATAAA